MLEPLERKPVTLSFILLLVTLGSSVVSIGYQVARLEEDTRRIEVLESKMSLTMSRDDATDIKRRLERIEDKVDNASASASADRRRR